MKKTISIFTGALFLGLGIGTIILKEVELSSLLITLITITCLVVGGFLTAIGLTIKKPKQEEPKKENNEKENSNNNSEPGIQG